MTEKNLPENEFPKNEEAAEEITVKKPENDLPGSEETIEQTPEGSADSPEEKAAGRRGKKKESYGFKGFLNLLLGKNADGSKRKAVYQSKKRTILRYVTVALAFLGIVGLAAIAYQVPKIAKEGGVRFEFLEAIFDRERTKEERDYDYMATPEKAFAYREKQDGTISIAGYTGVAGTEVVIPRKINGKPVTEIDAEAFLDSEITSVTLCSTITKVGQRAFQGCDVLYTVVLSRDLQDLGESAFNNCVALKSITIPAKVTEIKPYTFANCNALENVTVENGPQAIGRGAFENSGVLKINLPASVKTVDAAAFKNCKKLLTLSLSDGTEHLNDEAFYGCSSLENVTLSKTVKQLGARTFYGCASFKTFTGGSGVREIGTKCFAQSDMPQAGDYKLILGDGILVKYYGVKDSVEIFAYDNVKTVGEGAFEDNKVMKNVTIPETVSVIEADAFRGCSALSSLSISQNVTKIGANAFSGCTSLSMVINLPANLTELGDGAFSLCTALKGVVFPESLKDIPANAFTKCVNLVEIEFKGQTSIGNGAFADCSALEEVILTPEMTSIGDYAFADCSMLVRFNATKSAVSFIGENAFVRCTRLTNIVASRGSYANEWGNNHGL